MTREEADQMFDAQMRNLRYAATIVEGRDRPDRDDIAESCRWAESRLKHYRERDAALSSAPPDPRPVTDASPAVGVDGYDGEGVLAWWPIMTLDDDGNLTDTISEGRWLVTFRYGDGSWFEPAEMEADWCDDEQQYGEAPLFWLRLPPDPVPTSEGGGKQYPGVAASIAAPAPPVAETPTTSLPDVATMTPAEIDSELVAHGRDPVAVAREGRAVVARALGEDVPACPDGQHSYRRNAPPQNGDVCFVCRKSIWMDGQPASPVVAPAPVVECAWTPDEDTSSWDTDCGRKWTFLEDGPTENRVDYCMGCGKPVALSPRETPDGGGR